MDIQQLEPEFLDFIRKYAGKYGQPLMYCSAGQTKEEEQLVEQHYQKHDEFLGCCVPHGCDCLCNICCWTLCFPLALCYCQEKFRNAKEGADSCAHAILAMRHVIFPTMLVTFIRCSDYTIKEMKVLHYADHLTITPEAWEDYLDAENDGINGAIQGCMVPAMPGVLVFTGETRKVFTGGDRRDPGHWEDRRTPTIKIISTEAQATKFCELLLNTVREFRMGNFQRPAQANAPDDKTVNVELHPPSAPPAPSNADNGTMTNVVPPVQWDDAPPMEPPPTYDESQNKYQFNFP